MNNTPDTVAKTEIPRTIKNIIVSPLSKYSLPIISINSKLTVLFNLCHLIFDFFALGFPSFRFFGLTFVCRLG